MQYRPRRALAELDPDVPLLDVRSMDYYVDEHAAGRRFPILWLGAFAGTSVLLAYRWALQRAVLSGDTAHTRTPHPARTRSAKSD